VTGRPSPILEHGVAATSGPLIVFSLYLLFAGHNQPGGGFAGGLVAGVALALLWAAGGTAMIRRVLPVRSTVLLGVGLLIAAGTGAASLVLGLGFLESGYLEIEVPLVGDVKLVSPLLFDIGVYFVVLGMSLGLIRALGEDEEIVPDGGEEAQ
jgi:multicomponent Na+:H+ antiporter subunit A